MIHDGAWVEFELDLPKGEYTLIFKLGTVLTENNINDAMRVAVSLRATTNIASTPSAQVFEKQINALLMRATHREASRSEMDALTAAVLSSAVDDVQQRSWFNMHNSRCPEGMLRGWTTLIHGVLTSYGYLHD